MTDESQASNQDVVSEIARACLMTRTRRISRVITGIYDQELRPFGINSPQFNLLALIARLGGASRAEIGRINHQDRSTLTRNLQIMLTAGWVEETSAKTRGRAKPLSITKAGQDLMHRAVPAWRKAQLQAKDVLGERGAVAITDIADGL
jgi:DNA-binding MarR family transcriptional regulator